jgi:hypothetical protein
MNVSSIIKSSTVQGNDMENGYSNIGLSESFKLKLLLVAALIAVINLLAAWIVAYYAQDALMLNSNDMRPFEVWLKTGTADQLSADARYDLNARAMTLVSSMKLISNKQSLILAAFGAAFALLAIGFALFIIGADGAFKVMAQSPENAGKVVITGTAPGLFCFLISGVLVVFGITHRSELHAPDLRSNTNLVLNGMNTSMQEKPTCKKTDMTTGECK